MMIVTEQQQKQQQKQDTRNVLMCEWVNVRCWASQREWEKVTRFRIHKVINILLCVCVEKSALEFNDAAVKIVF